MEVTITSIVIGAFGTDTEGLSMGLENLEIRGRVETIQTTTLFENGQNTEKSLENLRRVALTQTPVKYN